MVRCLECDHVDRTETLGKIEDEVRKRRFQKTDNSVNIVGPSTIVQSGVTFTADLNFLSESLNFALPFVQVNAFFGSPGLNPDVVVKENGVNILLGNFVGNLAP